MAFWRPHASSANSQALLSLRDVTKSYDRRQVLRIAKFDIAAHDSIFIFGSNGGGKSTFLRLLAGITQKTSGEFYRSPQMHNYLAGFVPQAKGVNPEFSVARNLRSLLQLYDRPVNVDLAQLRYVAEFGLEPFLDKPVANLSGGYQKLVTLATVLSINPQVLFLDEPFSGLDQSYKEVVSGVINRLAASTVLLVVTGHSPGEFDSCQRRVEISGGMLQEMR